MRRIALAPTFVSSRDGIPKYLLKKYKKYFNIDLECAIFELKKLGIKFDETYLSNLRKSISKQDTNQKKHHPIELWEFNSHQGISPDSNDKT